MKNYVQLSFILLALASCGAPQQQPGRSGIDGKYATEWFDPNVATQTYCNPTNIGYLFTSHHRPSPIETFRSTADPVIVPYKGDYWLFCTNQSGAYYSKDFADWEYVPAPLQRLGNEDDQCAPAAFTMGDTLVMVGSTYHGQPVWMTTDPKSGRWTRLVDFCRFPAWDPGYLLDDDGRFYLYYGSSGHKPLRGVELDRKTFEPVGDQSPYIPIYEADSRDIADEERLAIKETAMGDIKEVIALNPSLHGWERFGENNDMENPPWGNFIEGAWMTKHNGKYYLQYGAPGTEFKVYADGVHVSDSPLGPFEYQYHNPFCYKPGGFVQGSGHGATFTDFDGNYWHTATCMLSVKNKFERRIGIYPAGFDGDGVMYSIASFGDYPTLKPGGGKADHRQGRFAGWMLLSYGKPVEVSSTDGGYPAANATDENIKTYWSAATADPGEWLSVDLGDMKRVNAVQVNYADHKCRQHGYAADIYHRYKIYHSPDGKNWQLLVDKSYNDRDVPHDYVELTKPVNTRFLKLENVHMADGLFAVSDFRVFGNAESNLPSPVSGFRVERSSDPRNGMISWSPSENAYGYNVYFGVYPDKLYNTITVNGATSYDFRGMDADKTYYFAIEALGESGVSARSEVFKTGI